MVTFRKWKTEIDMSSKWENRPSEQKDKQVPLTFLQLIQWHTTKVERPPWISSLTPLQREDPAYIVVFDMVVGKQGFTGKQATRTAHSHNYSALFSEGDSIK